MSVKVENSTEPTSFQNSNLSKALDDLQIVLDVALAVLVCLGEGGLLQPPVLGGVTMALAGCKALMGLVSLLKDDKKESKYAKLRALLFAIGVIAIFVLSSFLIGGRLEPRYFAVGFLAVDLTLLCGQRIAKRMCGNKKNRYSCCQ